MSDAIKPAAAPLSFVALHHAPASPVARVQPQPDALEQPSEGMALESGALGVVLDRPALPDAPGPFVSRPAAAGVVLDGSAYCQRHLAEAIRILTTLAGARMESTGRAKARYGKSEMLAALEAAALELKNVKAGRKAGWVGAGSTFMGQAGANVPNAGVQVSFVALSQALKSLDKTFGFERTVDDISWQKSYVSMRERMSKQLEEMQGGEYEKAFRLLERSLETTRQMASNNTDTIRSISNNL